MRLPTTLQVASAPSQRSSPVTRLLAKRSMIHDGMMRVAQRGRMLPLAVTCQVSRGPERKTHFIFRLTQSFCVCVRVPRPSSVVVYRLVLAPPPTPPARETRGTPVFSSHPSRLGRPTATPWTVTEPSAPTLLDRHRLPCYSRPDVARLAAGPLGGHDHHHLRWPWSPSRWISVDLDDARPSCEMLRAATAGAGREGRVVSGRAAPAAGRVLARSHSRI